MSATAWPRVSLGDLLTLQRRPVEVLPDREYKEIGIYCHGGGIFHKNPRTGLEVGDKALFQMRSQDLILQVTFAWEGAIAVCSDAEDGLYGSSRYPTYRTDEKRCNPHYLAKYLGTHDGLAQIDRICPGSAGRNRVLALKRVPEITVPLPPLEEQNRIVAKLDALAAKIDEARLLATSATDEEKCLRESFASELLDSFGTKHPMKALRDLVTVRGGGTPSKSNPTYWSGTIPWITPKDMKKRQLSDAIDHISKSATEETAAKLIETGAVLVVVRGMILVHTMPSAVLLAPAAINQDMKALITRGEVSPEYLCAALWAWNHRILERVEKSTHDTRRLETDALLDFQIPVPPSSTQCALLDHLNTVTDRTTELSSVRRSQEDVLTALLPSLLDRAFRGEL